MQLSVTNFADKNELKLCTSFVFHEIYNGITYLESNCTTAKVELKHFGGIQYRLEVDIGCTRHMFS